MNSMFNECNSLTSLPDISKWNTSKVIYIFNMFCGCKSLSSLPDISKWDTSNIEKICHLIKIFHKILIYLRINLK